MSGRLIKAVPPCTCPEHGEKAPRAIGDHAYMIEVNDESDLCEWRWRCSCKRVGRWQYQSDNAAYHDWRRHVKRWSS